jgi:hypothetical protein
MTCSSEEVHKYLMKQSFLVSQPCFDPLEAYKDSMPNIKGHYLDKFTSLVDFQDLFQ